MKTTLHIGEGIPSGFFKLTALLICLAAAGSLRADVPAPSISQFQPHPDGSVLLKWDATPECAYRVLTASNLTDGIWTPVDQIIATSNSVSWQANGQNATTQFYRLVTDAIGVRSIEPGVVSAGGTTNIYITGQGFGTNDVVTIGGVVQTNVQFLSSTLILMTVDTAAFTPDGPGYDVTVSRTGGGRSQVTLGWVLWTGTSTRALLEPPLSSPAELAAKANGIGHNKKGGITLFDGSNAARTEYKAKKGKSGSASKGRLAGPGPGDDCDDNDPAVCLWSGEVQSQVTDMEIPGRGIDFAWTRTYRSRTATQPGMAPGWTHCYDLKLQPIGGDILLFDGTGRSDAFHLGTNGTYTRPEFFCEGTLKNNVFTLTFPDTGKWVFNAMDSSATAGKIAQIVDRNGNAMSFGYDTSGRLSQVVDDLGRTNVVTYNTSGQLDTLTDFSGRTVTYHYYGQGKPGGSPGDLQSVISPPVTGTPNGNDFPSGKTTTYTYSTGFANDAENHLLLTVADGKNQIKYKHVYQHNQTDLEFLRCISSQYGTNAPVYFTHVPLTPTPSDLFATIQVTVRDSLGNVRDVSFDSRNRPVDERDYTGRAPAVGPVTSTLNRPTGKLRVEDPDYYEMQWSWNNDSLCVKEVAPGGDSTVCVYQSDFDKSASARKKGDLRVLRELPCCTDGDLSGDGYAELVTRIDYDPRFGSPAVVKERKDMLQWYQMRSGGAGTGQQRKDMLQWYQDKIGSATGVASGRKDMLQWYQDRSGGSSSRLLPTVNKKAINTKGTGATVRKVNQHAGEQCDQGGSSRLLPTVNKRTMVMSSGQPTIVDNKKGLLVEFTITMTDAVGNVTRGIYDPHGNLLECKSIGFNGGNGVEVRATRSSYNAYGQLTTVTNPADGNGYSSVDTLHYYTNGTQTGYLADWTVDTMGPVVTITRYEYDSRGNVTRCVDPRGNDVLCVYNALDQLMQCSSPSLGGGAGLPGYRIVSQYTYDAADNLTSCALENRDATGAVDSTLPLCTTTFTYDDLNRCVRTDCARDASHTVATECVYDANDNLVLYRSGEAVNGNDTNKTTQFTYDERDLLFTKTQGGSSGQSSPVVCSYTADGDLATTTYGDGGPVAQVSCVYDGFQRLTTITDQMGNVVSNRYDANGNVLQCTMFGETNDVPGSAGNVVLAQTTYQYDVMDRCVGESRLNPSLAKGAATTSYVYAPDDECVSVTDDNGHTTHYAYDTVGRLSAVTDPKGNSVSCTYDENGNVLTVTQTDKSDLGGADQVFVTTMQYDAMDRCFSSSDNVGNTTQYAYDSRDNLTRQMDPNGNLQGWFYDGLSRCVLSIADMNQDGLLDFATDAGSARTFDDNGCVLTETDANTNTTSYVYDSVDRMVSRSRADGSHMSLVWSPRSNVRTSTDANGSTVTNTHDLNHNIIHRDIAARSGVAPTTTFETFAYDGCGRMTLASNDVSQLTYAYDTLGECFSRTQDGLRVAYTYDGAGNCLTMTYPGHTEVKYGYDGADCLTSVKMAQLPAPLFPQVSFDYVGMRPLDIYRANGANTRYNYDGVAGTPNPTGDLGWQQVARINHALTNGGAVMDQRQLAYDGNQNKVLRAQLVEFVPGQGLLTNRWGYNPLNAMKHAINTKGTGTAGITEDYTLDAVGNRISVTSNGVVRAYARDATTPSPADFQVDQYTTTPFGNELHDDNGNLVLSATAMSGTSYLYDYANRLVEVDDLSTGAAMPVVSFTYDALGERLTKTIYPTTPPLAPVTTYFVHGGGETDQDCGGGSMLEARAGGPGGAVSQVYCWSSKRFGIGTLKPEAPLGMIAGAGGMRFFHADELGNVLAVSTVNGNVLERYEYDDFGAPTFLTSDGTPTSATSSTVGNPYLFGGMEWDSETGLYCAAVGRGVRMGVIRACPAYMNVRDGRYILRAGVPLKFGENAYAFKGNNPWSKELCSAGLTMKGAWNASHNEPDLGGMGASALVSRNILKSFFTPGSKPSSSAVESRNTLKSYFETGDIPTQDQFYNRGAKPTAAQFGNVIDSMMLEKGGSSEGGVIQLGIDINALIR